MPSLPRILLLDFMPDVYPDQPLWTENLPGDIPGVYQPFDRNIYTGVAADICERRPEPDHFQYFFGFISDIRVRFIQKNKSCAIDDFLDLSFIGNKKLPSHPIFYNCRFTGNFFRN